jgi:hypothetical protein
MRPHTNDPDGGVHMTQRKEQVCDLRTWRKNGRDEMAGTSRRGRSGAWKRRSQFPTPPTPSLFDFCPILPTHAPPPRYSKFEGCSSKYLRHVIQPERVCPGWGLPVGLLIGASCLPPKCFKCCRWGDPIAYIHASSYPSGYQGSDHATDGITWSHPDPQ